MDEEVTLICRATDEVSIQSTLADETLQALIKKYGDVVAAKYVFTISWFNMLAVFLMVHGVPLETENKLAGKTSPL